MTTTLFDIFKDRLTDPCIIYELTDDYLRNYYSNIILVSDISLRNETELNFTYINDLLKETGASKIFKETLNYIQTYLSNDLNIFICLDPEESQTKDRIIRILKDAQTVNQKIKFFTIPNNSNLKEQFLINKERTVERIKSYVIYKSDEIIATNTADYMEHYLEPKKRNVISTGFNKLDKMLNGGLYSGLFVIGAITNLGKTTFCLNIANNIAKRENPVLIYSLEMTKNDLISKSIAREQSIIQDDNPKGYINGILYNSTQIQYNENNCRENKITKDAIKEFTEKNAKYLYIMENNNYMRVDDIINNITRFLINQTKTNDTKKPVIIIDYLQIIAPNDTKQTDKQIMDDIIIKLSKFARQNDICIIGISSINRSSYLENISLQAYKESGSIEYTADCVIGLEYHFLDELQTKKESEKKTFYKQEKERIFKDKAIFDVNLKVLKQRNYKTGESVISFNPETNTFYNETTEEREKQKNSKNNKNPIAKLNKFGNLTDPDFIIDDNSDGDLEF